MLFGSIPGIQIIFLYLWCLVGFSCENPTSLKKSNLERSQSLKQPHQFSSSLSHLPSSATHPSPPTTLTLLPPTNSSLNLLSPTTFTFSYRDRTTVLEVELTDPSLCCSTSTQACRSFTFSVYVARDWMTLKTLPPSLATESNIADICSKKH